MNRTLGPLALIVAVALPGIDVSYPSGLMPEDETIAVKDSEGVELPPLGKKKQDEKSRTAGGGSGLRKQEEPEFDEVIKESEKIDGLLPIYRKDDRYLIAIRPDQLDRDFMVSVTRETGIGESFLLAAQVIGDGPVRFRRVGRKIQMTWRNVRFTASDDPDIRRAVERSFSESLQGASKIESQPHPETKAVLVDLGPLLLVDYEAVGFLLGQIYQTPYNFDKENSSVAGVQGFPTNLEVQARAHFWAVKPAPFTNLPDPRSLFVTYRYSLSEIPSATGFMPRIADDRLGHFLALYQDFSDDRRDSPYVHYLARWNLQKDEPYAALSKPKEPITFWLENSIPKQYRKAVADGVLVWNKAFERIGFKDAIIVKQQPDDADWDAADARYSTVRWFVTTQGAFAIGPSRINPLTGQIYDADIGVAESIVRFTRREFDELVDPVAAIRSAYDAVLLQDEGSALAVRGDARHRLTCGLARGVVQQAAFGHALMIARGGQPGSEASDRYINDFLTHVIAHEVGHTLGLRHNFRASVVLPLDELQDSGRTHRDGLTGSVMDYIPVNLAPSGRPQGEYWQTELGPYDYWAIEYAYRPIDGVKRPEDELPDLRAIAARVAETGNSYGTDEDITDPRTSVWDLGSDPIAFYVQRAALASELWKNIPTRLAREGDGYQVMRRSFLAGMGEYVPSIANVTKFIGGVYSYRDHVGDPRGRLPLQPVPADTQRQAVRFLSTTLYSADSFAVPSELLNRLAPERWWDFGGTTFRQQRLELPLHDIILTLQQLTLNQLYRPVTLDRLIDMELLYPAGVKPFTLAEMFGSLQDSIWSELQGAGTTRIGSFRRGLQREHLKKLIELVTRPSPEAPEDAGTMARANLTELRGWIDGLLKTTGRTALDAATKAHLEETRARIEAALTAHMIRLAS